MDIRDATPYNWRQKYAGLGPLELTKLKRLAADLSLAKLPPQLRRPLPRRAHRLLKMRPNQAVLH